MTNWRPTAELQTIRVRARLYQQIRAFFADSDCLEVDTPLLATSTNTDSNIGSIRARNLNTDLYLQTSPEFAMKRLLASGSGSIYQICHAFREGEQGRRHRSEFTLLEWYRVGFDYWLLMDEMERLINYLSGRRNNFSRVSYSQLFEDYSGLDIHSISIRDLRNICLTQVPGTEVEELNFDQCLDLLISLVIAPTMQGYVFVYDYPVSQAALAQVNRKDKRLAERFELFHQGLELANGFSELTDSDIQRGRFEADNKERLANGLSTYPVDESLLAALESGLPKCAGVALGLDRFLMVLEGIESIDQVISFAD